MNLNTKKIPNSVSLTAEAWSNLMDKAVAESEKRGKRISVSTIVQEWAIKLKE